MEENTLKKKGKPRRGRPPKHGGYSFLIKGELPENRKHIRNYLIACRNGLIADVGGGTEEALSTSQIILVDRVISILGCLRAMEEYVRDKASVMEGNELTPCLRNSYLAYNNTLRLTLNLLGIEKKVPDEPGLKDYIESEYGEDKDNEKPK